MLHRWEVFICTTAEREYALEAWRLLDPDYTILTRDEVQVRLMDVPYQTKKSLAAVLARRWPNLMDGAGVWCDIWQWWGGMGAAGEGVAGRGGGGTGGGEGCWGGCGGHSFRETTECKERTELWR
jgi:hypothetical protein